MRLFLCEHERDMRDFAQESVQRTVDWPQNQLVLQSFTIAKCEQKEITLLLQTRLLFRETTEAILFAEGSRTAKSNASVSGFPHRLFNADDIVLTNRRVKFSRDKMLNLPIVKVTKIWYYNILHLYI